MWDRDRGLAYGLTQSGETVTTIKGGRVCNEGGKAEGGTGRRGRGTQPNIIIRLPSDRLRDQAASRPSSTQRPGVIHGASQLREWRSPRPARGIRGPDTKKPAMRAPTGQTSANREEQGSGAGGWGHLSCPPSSISGLLRQSAARSYIRPSNSRSRHRWRIFCRFLKMDRDRGDMGTWLEHE